MRTAGLRGQHRRRLLRRLRLGAGGRARSRGGWAHNPGAAGIRAAHGVDPFQFDVLDLHPVQPVGPVPSWPARRRSGRVPPVPYRDPLTAIMAVPEVAERNPNIRISTKVASNHGAILRKDAPAVADAVRGVLLRE